MKFGNVTVAFGLGMCFLAALLFLGCAGQRQGIVCDEMEYRLNSMSYSPDQRYYAEEELRACREEEEQKKGGKSSPRKSIYERFAENDSAEAKKPDSTGVAQDSTGAIDVPVSELMGDTSGEKTTSIYERYGAAGGGNAEGANDDNANDDGVNENSANVLPQVVPDSVRQDSP